MWTYKIELKDDEKEDHPDISHIPNDQPIPVEYPNRMPADIPMREPSNPQIPGPMEVPIRDPDNRPGIRVLNVEF